MIQPVEIEINQQMCDAWLAQPSGKGPWPGVIFCMDAVGVRANLKDMATRLASAGYVVLLPNIFYRAKKSPIVTGVHFPAQSTDLPKILEQIMPLVGTYNPQDGVADMKIFTEFLHDQPSVRPGPLGIFGYCMGGALAIRTAAAYPTEFGAVASFHAGGLVGDDSLSPHLLLPQISAALYVAHADHDPHMTADQISQFDHAAMAANKSNTTELYPNAFHHFTMADLPAFEIKAAEKHWTRLLDLFKTCL